METATSKKTVVSKRIRGSEQYKTWRTKCLRRDKYTCQECGATNTYLEVDHCNKPLAVLIQEHAITLDNINQKIYSCKELWDLTNGKTLCLPCHKKTETWANKAKKFLY